MTTATIAAQPARRVSDAGFLEMLRPFVAFPSVNSDPAGRKAIADCARWLAQALRRSGLDNARVLPTKGAPVVYADWRRAPGKPTVLVYGHYDVQPPGPRDVWRTPPFEATVRGARVYGRGTSDDKGPILLLVKGLEAHLARGGLPVNVVCMFEGEEETGSANTTELVRARRDLFAADVAILSDTKMLAPGRPAVTYAERGALSLELEVRGPASELHSGTFGGAVHNPVHALSDLVAGLHDRDGRVAIPGFYDEVGGVPLRDPRSMAADARFDAQMMEQMGGVPPWGEDGYTLYERTTFRPALSVTGVTGGHQGPGVKSVIPPAAVAKLNIRLVPDQDPERVERAFRAYVRGNTPRTVRSTVRTVSRAKPAVMDPRHPAMRAARRAYTHGFGRPPALLRSGGTIPLVATFLESLGVPTILMGFSLPDDAIHGPNESFYLPTVPRALATVERFFTEVGRLPGGAP
jgi:acetylornithine deacetylase/succinyl-diaminopimelate desuccinylase-like protein